jgi:hypothetical protein
MKTPALLAAAVLLLAPFAARADPAEIAAQRSYVLTMDMVQRYAASARAEKAAVAADPSIKAELTQMQGPQNEEVTPTQAIARLKAHPRLYAFFKTNGFSEADAIMVGVVIINASFAAGEHDLSAFPGVTPAQVAFMKAHDAELRKALKGVFTDEP